MSFSLLPREYHFFDLFDKQVDFAMAAAAFFKEVVLLPKVDEVSLQKMRDIEHRGDDVAHEIFDRLNKTFITPFDREDIHSLTKELDDVIDMICTIVNRMMVYKIQGSDKNLVQFAAVIDESARGVACAVKGLRNKKLTPEVLAACVEINRLENVGDSLRDAMLAELFETAKDPVVVIKLKEIYQDAETVLDICEDVAHVVETILVKQA